MSNRRSTHSADEKWISFVEKHSTVIGEAHLSGELFADIDRWEDFLHFGEATVAGLSEQEYAALLRLVESYFAYGYEFFIPTALKSESQDWLKIRFWT